jgi:hypothetical protein
MKIREKAILVIMFYTAGADVDYQKLVQRQHLLCTKQKEMEIPDDSVPENLGIRTKLHESLTDTIRNWRTRDKYLEKGVSQALLKDIVDLREEKSRLRCRLKNMNMVLVEDRTGTIISLI